MQLSETQIELKLLSEVTQAQEDKYCLFSLLFFVYAYTWE